MLLFAKIGDVPNSGAAAFNAAKIHYQCGSPEAAAQAAASAATSFVLVNQVGDAAAAMRLQGLCKAKIGDMKAASDLLQGSMQVAAESEPPIPDQLGMSAVALADIMPLCEQQRQGYATAAGAFKA